MKMKTSRLLAIVISSLAAASAVQAQWYVGGAVGQSELKDDIGALPAGVSADKRDTGYKLYGGYSLNRNLAVEAGYVDHGKFTLSSAGTALGIKGYGLFVDAVGLLPLNNSWTLRGKVGLFNGHAKTFGLTPNYSDNGTDWRFGVGAAYALNNKVQVVADWERSQYRAWNDRTGVDQLSIGVTYGF
jgi:OOP family OmpA-OmpF porin